MKLINDIPRRSITSEMTNAELAIREAMLAIEEAGAHPLLNNAQTTLTRAKDMVADFVELSDCRPSTYNHMTFGDALDALKQGQRVARAGWNGKGMYLWLLPAANVKAEWCREVHLKAVAVANGGEIECLGSIRMMTADKKVLTGWLASQTDMLANDWQIIE